MVNGPDILVPGALGGQSESVPKPPYLLKHLSDRITSELPGLFTVVHKPEAQAKDAKGLTFDCASALCHTHCAESTGAVNNPGLGEGVESWPRFW